MVCVKHDIPYVPKYDSCCLETRIYGYLNLRQPGLVILVQKTYFSDEKSEKEEDKCIKNKSANKRSFFRYVGLWLVYAYRCCCASGTKRTQNGRRRFAFDNFI